MIDRIAAAVADTGRKDDLAAALASRLDLDRIANVVVIYAENRSFNNLFANFPGATGVAVRKDAKKKGVAPRSRRRRIATAACSPSCRRPGAASPRPASR